MVSGVREVEMEAVGKRRSRVTSGELEASREVRWSACRKEQVVLRLLRGESLDLLAREVGQPAGRIAGWREEFLQAGREGLKSRPRPEDDRRLVAAQRKVGELQLEVDILRALLERKGSPTSPRRSR
jgi:transposase